MQQKNKSVKNRHHPDGFYQGWPVGNQNAFTLIELLVVVLIIGILTAIALPKYQKSVNKSRFATLKPMAKSFADAQEAVYLASGSYATEKDVLAIAAPSNTDITIELSQTAQQDYVRASYSNLNNRYLQYLKHSSNFAGNIYCEALATDTSAQELCLNEGGTDASITRDGYKWYLLQGNSTGEFAYQMVSSSISTNGSQWTYEYSDGTNTITIFSAPNNGSRYWKVSVNGEAPVYYWAHVNGGQKLCESYPFYEGCQN